jgi:hypothetical protein
MIPEKWKPVFGKDPAQTKSLAPPKMQAAPAEASAAVNLKLEKA